MRRLSTAPGTAARLRPQRPDTYVSQPDVRYPIRQAISPSRDQVAADQPLALHEEQVFEYLAFFTEVFQVPVVHREDPLRQVSVYFL